MREAKSSSKWEPLVPLATLERTVCNTLMRTLPVALPWEHFPTRDQSSKPLVAEFGGFVAVGAPPLQANNRGGNLHFFPRCRRVQKSLHDRCGKGASVRVVQEGYTFSCGLVLMTSARPMTWLSCAGLEYLAHPIANLLKEPDQGRPPTRTRCITWTMHMQEVVKQNLVDASIHVELAKNEGAIHEENGRREQRSLLHAGTTAQEGQDA